MPINPDVLLPYSSAPPNTLLPWLNHQESLTDKLKQNAGEAHLDVVHQSWDKPDWWALNVLDVPNEQVLRREILMRANNKICWYARTIISSQSYKLNPSFFDRLLHEPLTKLIFDTPQIERLSFISYPITPLSTEYHWLNESMHKNETVLWARLAEYVVNKSPFYLVEILLPGLPGYNA